MANEKRWSLAIEREFPDGEAVDIWAYTRCAPVASARAIPFFVDVEGEPVDFNPTAFGTIVASRKMANVVSKFVGDEVQRLPAAVRGAAGEWDVLNILSVIDCINHSRSKIQYYPKDHPEKPGKPRGVMKLIVDPQRAFGHHLFKPEDWRVATIVSEELKVALENAGITGIEFWPVTDEGMNGNEPSHYPKVPKAAPRQVQWQSFGLLCPKCTAVLTSPDDDVHLISCPHCGEQIELVRNVTSS